MAGHVDVFGSVDTYPVAVIEHRGTQHSRPLSRPGGVVLGNEDVLDARVGLPVEGPAGHARDVDVSARGDGNGVGVRQRRVPEKARPLERARRVVLGEEGVGAAGVRLAPEVAVREAGEIDITAAVDGDGPGGIAPRRSQQAGPLAGARSVVLDEHCIGAPRIGLAVEVARGVARHVDVAAAVDGDGAPAGLVGGRGAGEARPLPCPRTVVLGEEDVVAAAVALPVQVARRVPGNVDIPARVQGDPVASVARRGPHQNRAAPGARLRGGVHGGALGRYVPGRVGCRHPVRIGGACRKPRIGVARSRRRRDEASVAVDPIACHRHVVRRGRPGKIDPRCGDHRGLQVRGNGGRRGIQRRYGHGPALSRCIARAVIGRHRVAVARDLGEPRVGVARPGRGPDLAAVAIDPVARHPDVIRRGRPGEVDLRGGGPGPLEVRGNGGRRGIGRGYRRGPALGGLVAASIVGRNPVAVARGLGKPRVGEARRCRHPDLAAVAVDLVPGNPHVVRRGRPGQVDLGRRRPPSPGD